MSQLVRISHPELLLFSNWTAPGVTEENSGRTLSWRSEEMDTPTLISCVGSFDRERAFNAIYINVHEDFPEFFPNTFRIDISSDGHVWEPIIHESDFRAGLSAKGTWNFPLITARHIKFLFLSDKANKAGKYFSAYGEFRVMVSGLVDVDVSSELDRLWVNQNLIDERPEYGWSSSLRPDRQEEFVNLDLGSVNRVAELRLLSKDDQETFFPEVFQVSYSEDNIAWHHLLEENGFLAEPGTWYRWRFIATNIRFLRLTIKEGARTREGKYISQIIELELYAAPELLDKGHRNLPAEPTVYASVLRSGIVRMAMDGEFKEGVAIQANDRRLRDATSESKGIVELASDGEDRDGVVVQGNDRRLRYATEDLPGIVRLARDGEVRAGHALQSTDQRIKPSTEETLGLVELASDGENRPGVVVQGNDRRLRPATTKSPGIVRLAESASDRPNEAVQGNDPRLRNATVEYRGIMRFARAGEESDEAAVQGNDPRLRSATTESPGIVELARDGEDQAGVVVQGNDKRLKYAAEDRSGIVELAPAGGTMKGRAVQANDPRLSDAREPLQHEHDYAPLVHDYESHSGHVKVKGEMGTQYKTLTEPPAGHAPIAGLNSGGGAGVVGNGRDGVMGTGKTAGVVGYGLEDGVGIVGAGRGGAGGYFLSEKGYSVVAGGEYGERGLYGSSLGMLVRGRARFTDGLYLSGQDDGVSASMACFFPVENSDVIVPGDVMVSSNRDGILTKSRDYGSTGVVGVVVEKASIVLNHPDDQAPAAPDARDAAASAPRGMKLVAVAGIVDVRAIADKQSIRPGDMLTASIQSGRAEKFTGKNYKPGMLFARSLSGLNKGEGTVRALLVCG